MKTDKITIYNIFEPQRRYLIPIFQRGYVWTRERQWEPLWMDIVEQAEFLKKKQGTSKNNLRKHFLGAMVLDQVPTVIREVPASEVIDGQQRLLTLQVLLTSFRDAVRDLDDEFLNASLKKLTVNPPPLNHHDESHKVWPTSAYQDDIRNVFTAGSQENLAQLYPQKIKRGKLIPPRPGLVEAYFYFYTAINGFLEPDPDEAVSSKFEWKRDQAYILFETISQYLQFVEIQLEAEDDPQVIFETLNDRGSPLTPSDLIRNYIFLSAQRQDRDVNTLYEQWWKDFDEDTCATGKFWKEKERQGRFTRSRLDLFFYHYLTQKVGEEIKMDHVYQEYKQWWTTSLPVLENELAKVKAASNTFKRLLAFDNRSRFGVFAQRLKQLDTTTVYPLILWLYENSGSLNNNEELDGILKDLESYIVRRAVCRLTPKGYNKIFMNLLTKFRQAPQIKREVITNELLAMEGPSAVWPDNTTFKRALIYEPLYRTIRPKGVRLLLTGIELASRTSRQEAMALPISNQLSIEHVMPQHFVPEEWPYPDSMSLVEDPGYMRSERIHSLGNLTLLTQPLNSEISNGAFSLKRGEIAKQSLLVLNSYFQQFDDSYQWDEVTILRRGTLLADQATKIWEYPE